MRIVVETSLRLRKSDLMHDRSSTRRCAVTLDAHRCYELREDEPAAMGDSFGDLLASSASPG